MSVLGKNLGRVISEWVPFPHDADFSRAFGNANFAIRNIINGAMPNADTLIHICHFLGDLNPIYLFDKSDIPYVNGDSLGERYNTPQGENVFADCVLRIAAILDKRISCVYRFGKNIRVFRQDDRCVEGFTLATTLRYGHQIETKIFYTRGIGITGSILDRFGGEVIAPTRRHQTYLPFRSLATTGDASCFLVILAIEDKSGEPTGLVKIEDNKNWDFASEEEFRNRFCSEDEFIKRYCSEEEIRGDRLSIEALDKLKEMFKEIYSSKLELIKEVARKCLEENPHEGEDSWWLRGKIGEDWSN